jgi:hypothetical protein
VDEDSHAAPSASYTPLQEGRGSGSISGSDKAVNTQDSEHFEPQVKADTIFSVWKYAWDFSQAVFVGSVRESLWDRVSDFLTEKEKDILSKYF